MEHNFPSYDELKEFIRQRPRATICQIRDHFKQRGDDHIKIGRNIVASGINGAFFEYLQEFIKQDYVIVEEDAIACLISDSTRWTGPGKFLPVVLSIKP